MGWSDAAEPTPDTAPAPGDLDDADAFWALAHGWSMAPEGVRPGDYCLVSPGAPVRAGQRVWIRDVRGATSIKRLLEITAEGYRLRGWLPPEDGKQASFEEERLRSGVDRIAPVLLVHRGRPRAGRTPLWAGDPRAPAEAPAWLRAALRLPAGATAEDALVVIGRLYAAARRVDPDVLPPAALHEPPAPFLRDPEGDAG